MLTPAEHAEWCRRLDERRAERQASFTGTGSTVWPTPDDTGLGVVPIELAPGRGDLRYSSMNVPSIPIALDLVGHKIVSFARLFQSQPWIASAVMWMLTRAVRVPLKAYRRVGGENERNRLYPGDHPIADLLVNPWRDGSGIQLTMAMLGPILVHGNSVIEIDDTSRTGRLQLAPRDWRFSMPIMPWRGSLDGFIFDYDNPAFRHEQSVDKVLHTTWWSPTGPIGTSPLQQLGITLGIEDAAQRYQRAIFLNGARPPSAITMTEQFLGLKPHERALVMAQIREDIAEIYSGPENAGRPALLPPGLDWKSIGASTVEAILIDQRKITREEIAGVYQIPPPLLGILDRACLPADALIQTEHGPRAVVDVQAGDRVWTWKDKRLALSVVSWSGQTGFDRLVTVRTGNRTLRCTDNHPVLVARRHKGDRTKRKPCWSHEWVPAGQLARGDLIVTLDRLPEHGGRSCPTREHVSEGFVEFCGLLLGDGNVKYDQGVPASIGIARSQDARYMDHYRQVMRREFRALQRGGKGGRELRARIPIALQEQERQTRFSSRLAAEEMVKLGLAGTAHTKRVPEWVGSLAPDLRAAFLRGFCDADGSVDRRGHLSVHSANQPMLRQIRELFMGLGVPVSNLKASRSWVTLPGGNRIFSTMWSFKAADPEANARIIGSRDSQDVARMQAGQRWARKRYAYRDRSVQPPRIDGCGLARVLSVSYDETVIPVYDLEVPDGHNFIAEGVVTHNTYSNIETQRDLTYTDCLGPPLILIEQAINTQIIRNLLQEPDVFVEHDFTAVLRGSTLEEIQAIREGIGTGIMTPNEGRDARNMPRSRNPGMDEFYLPFNNLQPVGSPPTPPPAPFGGSQAPQQAPQPPPRALHVRSRDRDYALALP